MILNYYVSAGENVSELMSRLTLSDDETDDTNDLKDSGAQELPASMSINWVDRKFVFFMEKSDNTKDLEIKFSNEFSDIKIKDFVDFSVSKLHPYLWVKVRSNGRLHVYLPFFAADDFINYFEANHV